MNEFAYGMYTAGEEDMTNNKPQDEWEVEFDRLFVKQGIPIGIAKYEDKRGVDITPSKIKDFIRSLAQSEYQRGRIESLTELIEQINNIKESVRKETGSYKYDSCYEDCIAVIEKALATDKPGQ